MPRGQQLGHKRLIGRHGIKPDAELTRGGFRGDQLA
jgi:hypothetical protein